MNTAITITDMAGARIEHSSIIVNFVAMVKSQLKNSLCRVFSDNVQYKWTTEEGEKIVIPDASINCQVRSRKGNSFTNSPQLVMEVLSPSTEKYDKTEKMELYASQEIPEYWIVDWENRFVEVYLLDYENDVPKYFLRETVTDKNKEKLRIISMPNIKMDFEELLETDF